MIVVKYGSRCLDPTAWDDDGHCATIVQLSFVKHYWWSIGLLEIWEERERKNVIGGVVQLVIDTIIWVECSFQSVFKFLLFLEEIPLTLSLQEKAQLNSDFW